MKLTDTPSDRGFLPNIVKSFHEWSTGRHNISIADLAIESAWLIYEAGQKPLTPNNGPEVAEKIGLASAHMSQATRLIIDSIGTQKVLGGLFEMPAETVMQTFGGTISVEELSNAGSIASGYLQNLARRLERFKDLDPERPLADDSTAIANIPAHERGIREALEHTLRVIEVVDPGQKRLAEYFDLIQPPAR